MVERNLGSTPRPAPQAPIFGIVAPPASASAVPPASAPPPGAPPPASKPPASIGLSLKSSEGFVTVTAVAASSPSDIGGVRVGDVILEVDGRPVTVATEVVKAFSSTAPGRAVSLTVVRGGERKRAIVVAPKP